VISHTTPQLFGALQFRFSAAKSTANALMISDILSHMIGSSDDITVVLPGM
jgi:hypothetical protein